MHWEKMMGMGANFFLVPPFSPNVNHNLSVSESNAVLLCLARRCEVSLCCKPGSGLDWRTYQPLLGQVQPLHPSYCSMLCLPITSFSSSYPWPARCRTEEEESCGILSNAGMFEDRDTVQLVKNKQTDKEWHFFMRAPQLRLRCAALLLRKCTHLFLLTHWHAHCILRNVGVLVGVLGDFTGSCLTGTVCVGVG